MRKIFFSCLLFIFIIGTSQAQWVQNTTVSVHADITEIENQGNYLYAVAEFGRVFVSSDCGMTWALKMNGLPPYGTFGINDIVVKGNTVYIGGTSGIYRTMDHGDNWTFVSNGINDTVTSLFFDKGKIYAGTKGSGFYVTNNDGTTWTPVTFNGIPSGATINTYYRAGNVQYLGIYQYGIYVSTDRGDTWHAANNGLIQPPNSNPNTFLKVGNTIFVGISNSGIFSTTNNGENWVNRNTGIIANGNEINDLMTIGNNYIAVALSGGWAAPGRGVYLSSNGGNSWYAYNQGLDTAAGYNVEALILCNTTLIAGTSGAGIWTRDVSELFAVNFAVNPGRDNTNLIGNYPNPFNPSTYIQFNLAKNGNVRLLVYDALGRVVADLVNSEMSSGTHSVLFDAARLASGIYYYKLMTDGFTDTKKMLLIK